MLFRATAEFEKAKIDHNLIKIMRFVIRVTATASGPG
jgi:hypothetical protein